VHQDGLVHISALADKFVKDPHDIVKAGEIVKVKVIEVDEKRKRIALSMRLTDSAESAVSSDKEKKPAVKRNAGSKRPAKKSHGKAPQANNAFAAAFAAAKK